MDRLPARSIPVRSIVMVRMWAPVYVEVEDHVNHFKIASVTLELAKANPEAAEYYDITGDLDPESTFIYNMRQNVRSFIERAGRRVPVEVV